MMHGQKNIKLVILVLGGKCNGFV